MNKLLAGILVLVLVIAGLLAWSFNSAKVQPAPEAHQSPSIVEPPTKNAEDADLKFIVMGSEHEVFQNAETDFEMAVHRQPYDGPSPTSAVFVLAGNFQGDVKLACAIVKGGKGLIVKFDPETVRGSDDKAKLRINADADADLGPAEVKITATIPGGGTIDTSCMLAVSKK